MTREIVLLRGLGAVQMAHLRELAAWFLRSKAINGVRGLEMTLAMRVAVASEHFFTAPDILKDCCPAVHRQLVLFYRRAAVR